MDTGSNRGITRYAGKLFHLHITSYQGNAVAQERLE